MSLVTSSSSGPIHVAAVTGFSSPGQTHSGLPQYDRTQALAVDALSQPWQEWSVNIFPPFPLLNKVIQKLRPLRSTNSYCLPLVAISAMVPATDPAV